jgi:hypothetical protein
LSFIARALKAEAVPKQSLWSQMMATMKQVERANIENANGHRHDDPITGEAGAHPVGTGVGTALGSALAGAAVGLMAGPLGTLVGAIGGGVVGGLSGKAFAEGYDPTVEADYWRQEYRNRPYHNEQYSYEHYEPAYSAGWESYHADPNAAWKAREEAARELWENKGGPTNMGWEEARLAAEDAHHRVRTTATKKAS